MRANAYSALGWERASELMVSENVAFATLDVRPRGVLYYHAARAVKQHDEL